MTSNHKQQPYYFLHIPKTGGTSLTAILDRFFVVNDIYQQQLWWNVGNIDEVKQQHYKFIRGHFGLCAQLLSKNQLKMWTMLRNPINLAHSTYQYIIREKNTKSHKKVTENGLSFEEFLQDSSLTHLVTNRLVKAFTFGLNVSEYKEADNVTAENFKSFRKGMNRIRKEMSNKLLLTTVKRQLKSLDWFGIQEDFDFAISMLCHQMAWPPVVNSPKLNVSTKSLNISTETANAIKKMNSLDSEFYQYAKQVYESKKSDFLRKVGLHDVKDLTSLEKIIDDNYQKHHLKRRDLSLNKSIEYDFSSVLLGQNWHQREWIEREQFYFRWTGPESRSSIDFWMKAANYKITIHAINTSDYRALSKIKIQVNEQTLPHKISLNGGLITLSLICEKTQIKSNGLLRLSFIDVVTKSHDTQFNSGDFRKVGIAVKKIDIIQLTKNS